MPSISMFHEYANKNMNMQKNMRPYIYSGVHKSKSFEKVCQAPTGGANISSSLGTCFSSPVRGTKKATQEKERRFSRTLS